MKKEVNTIYAEGITDKLIKFKNKYRNNFQQHENQKLTSSFHYIENIYSRSKVPDELLDYSTTIAQIAINEIGLSANSVIATFLYIAYTEGLVNLQEIEQKAGETITKIVAGLEKINEINISTIKFQQDKSSNREKQGKRKTQRQQQRAKNISVQTENYIQLALTLAEDVRSILIKLAFRLYSMRNLGKYKHSDKQINLSEETSVLYAPIAHRLGLYNVKTALEELSMKYLHNRTYKKIAYKLDETKAERDKYIDDFISPLQKALQKEYEKEFKINKIRAIIKGRPKSIFSIWRKMLKQNVPFEGIYDLFAIRIILYGDFKDREEEKAICWKAYSFVTSKYEPNPKRLRDWISRPKDSGYESLHTTVVGPEGKWVEVQIRTERMDIIAEKGDAAHWKYKENTASSSQDQWLAAIRDKIETPGDDVFDEENDAKKELYSNDIFIFTPHGDLKKMPANATVLDFAYSIHSELGQTCMGAVINGKMYGIKHNLQNGDKVEIISSKKTKPNEEWLEIVTTPRAKARIKRYLNEQKHHLANQGRDKLLFKLNQLKLRFDDKLINKLREYYKEKTTTGLYQGIGEGRYDLTTVKNILEEKKQPESKKSEKKGKDYVHTPERQPAEEENYLLIDEGMKNVDYQLAKCCNPIHGDNVFGFVTVRSGVKIHRINCPNAADMMSRYPYRIIKARWKNNGQEDVKKSFLTSLHLKGTDSMGIVSQITKTISQDMQLKLRSINIDSADGTFKGSIQVFVIDTANLNTLIKKIKNIPGVHNVSRVDG